VVDREDPVVRSIRAHHPEVAIIDICGTAASVLEGIGACEAILSSSLHGLIVADSLGIPNHWMELNRGPEPVSGAGFKFRDYYSAFDMDPPRPHRLSASDTIADLLALCGDCERPGLEPIRSRLRQSLERIAERDGATCAQRRRDDVAAARLWAERRPRILDAIRETVPSGATLVLVDEDQLPAGIPDRRVRPFLERDGQYWGPPADDDQAVAELFRMRREGARYLAVIWSSFWWLDFYPCFGRILREPGCCLMDKAEIRIFDLAAIPAEPPA
jgi:hypothetical protein